MLVPKRQKVVTEKLYLLADTFEILRDIQTQLHNSVGRVKFLALRPKS